MLQRISPRNEIITPKLGGNIYNHLYDKSLMSKISKIIERHTHKKKQLKITERSEQTFLNHTNSQYEYEQMLVISEMIVRATMKYHFMLTKTVRIKK